LSAIALPSLLSQANRARQAEASTYIGTLNRSQQAFFLERNAFGTFQDLNLGIPQSTKNYTYNTTPNGTVDAVSTATPQPFLRGYAGRAWIGTSAEGSSTTLAILCEGTPGNVPGLANATVCP
jgi:type IV pilus assembly protein PilA